MFLGPDFWDLVFSSQAQAQPERRVIFLEEYPK